MGFNRIYPLVNVNITMERSTMLFLWENPLFRLGHLKNSYVTNYQRVTRSILHGYFNLLVFWYQWEYLLTSKKNAGYLRLAMVWVDRNYIWM